MQINDFVRLWTLLKAAPGKAHQPLAISAAEDHVPVLRES